MESTAEKNKQHNKITVTMATVLILLVTIMVSSGMYRIHELQKAQTKLTYQAEAVYQRSFGELTDSIQTMYHLLAQLLITSGEEQLLYGLTGLWREVYAAINSLGSLPVAMHTLEQTDLLLNDIAEYSYYLMKKNVLTQQPLDDNDWKQLEEFYHRISVVQNELETLKDTILTESFYFTSVALDDESNPVFSAFRSIETQITALPAIQFEEGIRQIAPEPCPIAGSRISPAQAIDSADSFLKTVPSPVSEKPLGGELAFTLNHVVLPVYTIAYPNNRYVEISQIGGYALQYYYTKELYSPSYTINQAESQARGILQSLAFSDMVCVERTAEDTMATFIFVPTQDGVYLYPDMVKLQIALDDGTLLSFDQSSYQTRHHTRVLPKPAYTETDILKNRNPNFRIESVHLALINEPHSQKECLVYELRGAILNEHFAVFVDAQTGQELRIVHL